MRPLRNHTALKITSVVAAAFAFALVVWGAIVRINGAGMTCPDWPKCRGAWLPNLNDPVVYEFSHRVGAPVLTLLIVATFALAFRYRRELPQVMRLAWAANIESRSGCGTASVSPAACRTEPSFAPRRPKPHRPLPSLLKT